MQVAVLGAAEVGRWPVVVGHFGVLEACRCGRRQARARAHRNPRGRGRHGRARGCSLGQGTLESGHFVGLNGFVARTGARRQQRTVFVQIEPPFLVHTEAMDDDTLLLQIWQRL